MPELLGSPYILPVIVVALIALLVLLFLSMRSRKRAATGGKESKPAKVKAKRGKSARAPLEAADAADAAAHSDASPEATGEPPMEAQSEKASGAPSEPKRSSARQTRTDLGSLGHMGTGGAPSVDPITTVVNDVLRGWGDLTTEDTNRLAIFRADKVAAAIAAMELPKDLKNSEHARTRLGQLKHYGTSLQGGERPFHAAPRAEFAAIGLPASETSSTAVQQPSIPVDEADHGGLAAEETPYEEETAGEARAADASWGVEKKSNLWDEEPVTDLWGSETTDAGQDAVKDVAPTDRALPEVGWEPQVPSETEAPKAAGWDNAESAVAAAAAAFWAVSEAPSKEAVTEEELPVVEETVIQEELPVEEEEVTDFEEYAAPAGPASEATFAEPETPARTDSFFQTLGAKVSTAEDLLALPATEQETMLVFLEPVELNKVFRATGDPEIKKAIIDTLEHVGSPASLDIIQQCLEDPDPSVQMRALEAADRLLGSS